MPRPRSDPAYLALALLASSAALAACASHPSPVDGGPRDAPVAADGPTNDAPSAPPSDAGDAAADVGAVGDGGHCADYSPTKNLYWGDLHTHTALSADAYGWGNRNFPHDAYRFAQGGATPIAAGAATPGPTATIDRPLDWDAVTDHSEWLGATWGCGLTASGVHFDPTSPYYGSAECVHFRATTGDVGAVLGAANSAVHAECNGQNDSDPACVAFIHGAWETEIQAAHDAYQPCRFTSLVAFEWTHSNSGATLHQNVIFASETVPTVPLDSQTFPSTSALWNGLDAQCTAAMGCRVLTIPHNSNLSEGMAFELPTGADAIAQMNHYQRLVEIHQHKGDSECAAGSAASDPDCDFEHVPPADGGAEMPASFVRNALARGIVAYAQQRAMAGGVRPVDPFQLGIVAATDDHNGIPGYVAEATWQGHQGEADDTPAGRLRSQYHNPGGVTGVWAEENTREAIFDALERRETFGTSGPRIAVRFYQTWDAATDYCGAAGGGFPANVLAGGGVPMGGTMAAGPAGAHPRFVINALRDADDLAEVDLVRTTADASGFHESVQRFTPSSAGTVWSAGSSACVQWTDPDYDATQAAVYYVRVLQVPTWRWSHYDCMRAASPPAGCAAGGTLDVHIEERAWTSPIWSLP